MRGHRPVQPSFVSLINIEALIATDQRGMTPAGPGHRVTARKRRGPRRQRRDQHRVQHGSPSEIAAMSLRFLETAGFSAAC